MSNAKKEETTMEDAYGKKPWAKFYDPQVSPTLQYPRMSYAAAAREAFGRFPERVALYYMDGVIKFRDLDRLSSRLGRFLQKSGCQAGDVVGVHLLNVPACYISSIAIQKIGCVYMGVSALLSPDELEYQLKNSGAKILVTLDFFLGTVGKAVGKTGVKTVLATSLNDFLPARAPAGRLDSFPGIPVVGFMEALQNMSDDFLQVDVNPEDPCLMMYTGGTTGSPKGAILTHNNVVHHMVQMNAWTGAKMGEDVGLSAFPMFHQAGNFLAMWAMPLATSQVLIPNPRDLQFIISAIKKFRPTYIVNVPTIYLELMKLPEFRTLDFSGVRSFTSGASPFPGENIREFEGLVGQGKLIEVYGMTETTPVLTSLPINGVKKVASVGIPLSDTEVKLVDPESKEVVPQGEPGEVVARGPQVFTKGYYNNPEETAHTLREGWIYTGDIGVMDEDGYFYIVDRLKDMVSVSGFKVFTRQVDEVMLEHPDVDKAGTIGLPDAARPGSEIVACAVVLKPGREKSEEMKQRLIAYMKEKMAPYKVPKVIQFMDQLPMSAIGKVLKRKLKSMLMEGR
jgi:long-chain acyl-CoA synthetase